MGASRIIILVAIALIASAVYSPVSAKEVIVGNDSEANFSSIQEAVNNSSPGDVILVLPGIYNESVDIKVEGLSILSESGNPENAVVTAFTVSANNVVISGFGIQEYITTDINQGVQYCTFKHNKFPGINSDVGPTGIDAVDCFNCIFSDNTFSNSGIRLNAGGDITNVTIANNTIKGGSITLGGSSENKILNNFISNTISDNGESYGLNLFESHDNIIANNSISECNYAILMAFLTGNNNVSNNTLTSNSRGIVIDHLSPGNEVKNNTISKNDIGISIGSSCPDTLITGNRIQLNRDYGIYIEQTSAEFEGSSLIYNNFFNNTVNFLNNTMELQYGKPITTIWNTTKTSGTSIVGGPYLGGNFWAKLDGTGFSQMCIDSNGDGLCDLPYNIAENDSDYLPLTAPPAQRVDGKLILKEIRLTTDESYQQIPAIYGDRIVWTDTRNDNEDENYDIYMYDLSALRETQITTNESWQRSPAIYDNRIVWVDNRSGNWDIYMYDLSTSKETQITTNKSNQFNPVIYGDRIVWTDERNGVGNTDIYMYDLFTSRETQITTSLLRNLGIAIYGDRILYAVNREYLDAGNTDIYVYNLSESREIQITANKSVYGSAIYEDRIVWADDRNGNADIYMYNLSTSKETQITTNESDQMYPAIYGDRIVWQDRRGGNDDIYMYDISTSRETQITTNKSIQQVPVIYGDRIVWQDWRNGHDDIYMCIISSKKEPEPKLPVANFSASPTSGNAPLKVLFTDSSAGSPTSWFWDFGDGIHSKHAMNATHTYTKPGKYNVSLTVTNANGSNTTTKPGLITVEALKAPVADFSANVTSGNTPLKVLFTDNSKGSPTSWLWEFGDGVYSKHALNATHTFARPGTYNITLTVANAAGSNTVKKPGYITVTASKAPVANFSANITSGDAPLKVLFKDNSTGAPTSWFWDFGNGINSKHAMNATHTFTKPGTYNVTLMVTNAAGSNSVTKPGYITVTKAASTVKPVADFYSPEAEEVLNQPSDHGIYENEVVSFFDNSTGSPTSWLWDFGDGNTSTKQNPAHVYGKMGGYTVNLTVKNAAGSGTTSKYGYVLVGIGDEPASPAYFSSDVTSGNAPLTVTFLDDKDAEFPNYPIWREWDFGDGVIQSYMVDNNASATPYATHTYEKPGRYTVTLYLDNRGGKSIITKYHYITVAAPDNIPDVPVADFSANIISGPAPLVVLFTDASTGGAPTSWLWDFGDGIYSKHAMNATHTYTGEGTYNVTLTVKNDAGSSTEKKAGYITVKNM